MKNYTYLAILSVACMLAGCSEPANKTVTDGVDMDAIKAYEASVSALESSQATMDIDGKDDAASNEQTPAVGETKPAE